MQDYEMLESRLKGWILYLFYNEKERVRVNTFIEVYSPDKILLLSKCNISPIKEGCGCYFNGKGKPFCESKLSDMKVLDFMVYLSEVVPNNTYQRYSYSNYALRKFSLEIVSEQMCSLPIRVKNSEEISDLQSRLRYLVLNGINEHHYVPDADFVCRRA